MLISIQESLGALTPFFSPSPNILRNCYRPYLNNHKTLPPPKRQYTNDYKQSVIENYFENNGGISLTAKNNEITRSPLVNWHKKRHFSSKPDCISGTDMVKYSDEHKLMAVTEATCGTVPVFRICTKCGIFNFVQQIGSYLRVAILACKCASSGEIYNHPRLPKQDHGVYAWTYRRRSGYPFACILPFFFRVFLFKPNVQSF